MRGRSFLGLCLVSIIITACTSMCRVSREQMGPEDVVKAYLDLAFNFDKLEQRDHLIEYTTGDLKAALAEASPETIKTAYIDKRYSLKKFSVLQRYDRSPREAEVTYELRYQQFSPDKKDVDAALVTTENTVALWKIDGKWFIKDVVGTKTSFDFPWGQTP